MTTHHPTSNRLCRDVGHDWKLDATGTYRRCIRQACNALERRIYDTWVIATPSAPTPLAHPDLAASVQQLTFWTAEQHTERPRDLERLVLLTPAQRAHFARLERQYYHLISGPRTRKAW